MDDIEKLIAERQDAINRVYARTPQVEEANLLIARTRAARRPGGKTYCCLVWGRSGMGKSRILDLYAESQPEAADGTMPVLCVETPSPFSQAAFARAFLKAMGKPCPAGQQLNDLFDRVVKALRDLKVEVVLLDEISHVTDHRKKDGAVPYWVTDTIKLRLLEQACVAVIMTGVEAAKALFDMNPQLTLRRTGILQLVPFDGSDPKDFRRMLLLLAAYERAAGFDLRVFPGDEALGRRVLAATAGIPGGIANLMKAGSDLTTRKGAKGLDASILAEAHAICSDPVKGWTNAFLVDGPRPAKEADETRTTPLHERKGRKAA
jgi:hypothetical protein